MSSLDELSKKVHVYIFKIVMDHFSMLPEQLEKYLRHQISIVDTMGVTVVHATDEFVKLQAPLTSNRNHLGTAFGGSSYSIAVLACYTWLFNGLNKRNLNCHVVIKAGQMKYIQPVKGEIVSICRSPDVVALDKFFLTLERRKKAQLTLQSEICVGTQVCCVFEGEFVSLL